MKYIFVGGLWRREDNNDILKSSKGSIQFAANEYQLNLLSGFYKIIGDDLKVFSCRFIGSFPKRSKTAIVKEKTFTLFGNFKAIECGFLNLPLVKNVSKEKRLFKAISKEIINSNDVTIIGYSMTYSVVKTLSNIKRKNPRVKVCLIVPDLPEYMSPNPKQGFFKKQIIKYLYKTIKNFDYFVTLTEFMFDKLNVPTAKHCLVDGIISESASDSPNNEVAQFDSKEKRIVYTGTLEKRYGVKKLIDSFEKINRLDTKLVICGYGSLCNYIQEKAQSNKNIVYLGSISVEESKRVQKAAYLLINPREEQDFVKYSFPSKTLEYMLTGRPVLMSRLSCLSSEYDNLLFFITPNKGLEQSICEFLDMDNVFLNEKGQKAREYVLKHKSPIFQAKKILDMLIKE